MSIQLAVVEATSARMTSRFINLDDPMLEIDMDEVVPSCVGGPFNESRLRTIHEGQTKLCATDSRMN